MDADDIVQIDLTIIAGILIFLVLTNVFEFGSQAFQNKAFLILLLAVIPFSISAVLVVFENVKQGKSCEKYPFKWFALAFTTGGFLYLIAKVIMLSVDSF